MRVRARFPVLVSLGLLFGVATSEDAADSSEAGSPPPSAAALVSSPCLFDERLNALRCRDADLRRVSQGLGDLIHEVSVLDANFCHIPSLDRPLFNASLASEALSPRLTSVSIVNSELSRVSEGAFHGLETTLEHLDLSGNLLEAIPAAILHLARLVTLDLSRNRDERATGQPETQPSSSQYLLCYWYIYVLHTTFVRYAFCPVDCK